MDLRRSCVAFLATAASLAAQTTRPVAERPNVVLILADDLGYSDLGCFGSEIPTPNIDSLAKGGVAFTQFYNMARCCPTRAALMTGKYPHQVGVGAMIDGYAAWQRDAANDRTHYNDRLNADARTLPEMLRDAGYRTMMAGKWHLGRRPEEWPARRGFDRSFVQINGAMNYYGGRSDDSARDPMALDDKPWSPPRDGFYSTDAFADHAIEFLKESKSAAPEKPFFLYLPFNASHWPLQADESEVARFKGVYDAGWQKVRDARLAKLKSLGVVPADQQMSPMDRGQARPWNELPDDRRAEWARRMEIYAAQTAHLDAAVGRVLATLKELDVDRNTVVIFLSDNGGAAEDPNGGDKDVPIGGRDTFRGYGRPWASVSNTPWRLHKISAYEGGISTPLLVRLPTKPADAPAFVRQPAAVYDLVPTLLEWAGAPRPADLEGRSIVPLIRGESADANRVFCWEHEGNRAVRKGKWKLVGPPEAKDGAWQLYDVEADRIESRDVAADHPDVARVLRAEYDRWATRAGVADFATLKARRASSQPAQ